MPHDARYPVLFRLLQSNLAELADAIILHSQAALDAARIQLKANTAKVEIIPHGQYLEFYGERISCDEARGLLGLPRSGRILLFFGLLYPYKGVEDLLLAWQDFGAKTQGSYLLIVGQPESQSYSEFLRAQAEGLSNVFLKSQFARKKRFGYTSAPPIALHYHFDGF